MAKIRFENGTVVNFNGNPTQKDVEEVAIKLGIQKPQTPIQPSQSTGYTGLAGLGVGVLKGIGSTVKGIGTLATKAAAGVTAALDPNRTYGEVMKSGFGLDVLNPETEAGKQAEELLTAQTTSEKVGKGIEQIAEFFIPAGKLAKADKALDLIITGSKLSKPVKVASKIASSAALEGLGAGGVSLAQTGGDLQQAGVTALTAGTLRGGMKTAGEALRAVKIPEKLYSRIFKNEYAQVANEFKTGSYSKLAQTNPEKYAELVSSGIIKNNKFNETLAKQALDRGLKGSLSNMAEKVVEDTVSLEMKAQKAVGNKIIKLNKTNNLVKTLRDIVDDYKVVGKGEIAQKAGSFIKSVEQGKITGDKLLELRRFLDGMRTKLSYQPSPKLSLGQEGLKYWSDNLRKTLSEIPGLSEIMKDYSFNIKAFDSIVKSAKARNNNEILGLIDTVFLGTGNIVPFVARKAAMTPFSTTNIAQAIQKSSASPIGIGVRGVASNQPAK